MTGQDSIRDPGGPDDPIARLRDGTPVAAWLLKANPAVWDVLGALEQRVDLDTWRLSHSYRVELVQPGHPCCLWVTGGRHAPTTGVWAVGRVNGAPYLAAGDPDDTAWRDRTTAHDIRPFVPVELEVLDTPVRLAALAHDPRFARAEIVRAPRVASPVALRAEEWAAILDAID